MRLKADMVRQCVWVVTSSGSGPKLDNEYDKTLGTVNCRGLFIG
jgi:hypothetical protein